jgi:hypothetical protein
MLRHATLKAERLSAAPKTVSPMLDWFRRITPWFLQSVLSVPMVLGRLRRRGAKDLTGLAFSSQPYVLPSLPTDHGWPFLLATLCLFWRHSSQACCTRTLVPVLGDLSLHGRSSRLCRHVEGLSGVTKVSGPPLGMESQLCWHCVVLSMHCELANNGIVVIQ